MSEAKDGESLDFQSVPKGSTAALSSLGVSDSLPKEHRDQVLKQYDLPNVKVNIFDILRYGDRMDFILMVVGSVMSVCGGSLV